MFAIFLEFHLPPIPIVNASLVESEIKKWKETPAVKLCYEKLFKKIKNSEPETYMSQIIQKLWKGKKKAPKLQIAFAISVYENLLNPQNLNIHISESIIKPIIMKNLVSF
jgi:hypothetical protein